MTRRTAIWLLVMAVALTGSCVFGDLLTVKNAHGELKFSGLIQTYYAMFEKDKDLPIDTIVPSDTFELHSVLLGAEGTVYEKIDFAMLMELDHSPTLLEAWIRLKYIPKVDLTFGQMWKPVTYEALTSPSELPFVYYAAPTQWLMNTGLVSRDIGAKATFHLEKDDYTMFLLEGGVFNGTGINQSDNNDQKDWVTRACLQPIKGISFFGNYTRGTHGTKVIGEGHDEHQQYSTGLAVDYQGLDMVGEWMGLHYHRLLAVDPSMNGYGWYLHLGYKIETGCDYFSKVEPIVRYEYVDPDCDNHMLNDLQRLVTYGLNVFIDENYAKLQLNYIWNIDDSGPGCEIADNVFVAQLQARF
jgi:hypothetical protein